MRMTRQWAMPSSDTLSIRPIRQWVRSMLHGLDVVVDPFARNCRLAHFRNDLSPDTAAEYHMDAEEFLKMLKQDKRVSADAIIFDPPYSPRQISECYQSVGKKCSMEDTQSAVLYQRVRDAADAILKPGGAGSFIRVEQRGHGAFEVIHDV